MSSSYLERSVLDRVIRSFYVILQINILVQKQSFKAHVYPKIELNLAQLTLSLFYFLGIILYLFLKM